MKKTAMSRRTLLGAGVCTLAAAATIPEIASAHPETGLSPKNEATVRKYYTGWERKDWHSFAPLLADDFTFTSPFDDRISKSAYKIGCWDTQIAFIGRFDLTHVIGTGNEAFVMYVCHTTNGKTFRNVEYLRLKDEQVQAVECYFGGQNTIPSAVSGKK
ncbi:MAG TPA: nuclear transport factor 2 family protein [Steroidobacteraceae bacterium]|jgi:ketosteroid isomerase-like protein|nr:nuclear transport factor 2 family protein [Steroidobacteraceae bacterium]